MCLQGTALQNNTAYKVSNGVVNIRVGNLGLVNDTLTLGSAGTM